MLRALCFIVLFSVFCVAHADAAIIATWDVSSVDVNDGTGLDAGGSPYPLTSSSSHANASGLLTLGSGVNPSTSTGDYGFKISIGDSTTSLADAITKNHFMDVTITIDSGYSLALDSISFDGRASESGSDNVVLLSDVFGYSDSATQLASFEETGSSDLIFDGPIALSSMSEFQDLTGSVGFRFYGYNSTSGSGVTVLETSNALTLNGTLSPVAVPEPSSMALLVVGGVMGWVGRRRRIEKIKVLPGI